jgi:alkylation response protein AidB-like acyl-CoA dehydrogenase
VTALSADELNDFSDAVDGVLAKHWPHPGEAQAAIADADVLNLLWQQAIRQGWADLSTDHALDAAVRGMQRIGRVACCFPLMDLYVAGSIFARDAEVSARMAAGSIRPIVVSAGSDARRLRCVDAASAATHLVVLSDTGVVLKPIETRERTSGLARPDWSTVGLDAEVTSTVELPSDGVDRYRTMMRLGLTARAVGAAQRSLELSLQHARERHAFGHAIGSFQAVSHRAADGATELTAASLLIPEAASALAAQRHDAILASELAIEFGRRAAVEAQFGAQHTLAATGYFEEHEAPWLFRRVHSDVALLDGHPLTCGAVADMLIDAGLDIPALDLGAAAESFRGEVREFLAPFATEARVTGFGADASAEYLRSAMQRGYVTMAWPAEFGGMKASVEEQIVMAEELAYHRLPLMAKTAADLLGTAVIRHGSHDQQDRILPLIRSGSLPFYLGYSEPEVGSDLARLASSAVRDGEDWIVNGRKMWGTGADTAEWVWLAVRTDPDASPPRAGITVFLTKLDRAGWQHQQHRALSGEVSCSTFFDEYPVADADRIGEVNGGWKVISEALALERVNMANTAATVLRLLDDILAVIRNDPDAATESGGFSTRAELSRLAARLQAARMLVNASVRATAVAGGGARLEAPMAKVLSTLLLEEFSVSAIRMLGPTAALGETVQEVPAAGAIEHNLRLSIMQVVGGGTVDIQRNLIARALGMPRS